jgi:hypothetical protein
MVPYNKHCIHTFFQNYSKAFVSGNIEKLSFLYEYPLYLRHNDTNFFFQEHDFKNNLRALCEIYQSKKIKKFSFSIKSIVDCNQFQQVNIVWHAFDCCGQQISEFKCIYLLSKSINRVFKIIGVINIDEQL